VENRALKINPARSNAAPDYSVVLDLDEIISKPVAFKFRGKSYVVEPVSTETFLKLAEVLNKIQSLVSSIAQGAKAHDEDVYLAYYEYIKVLCPEFTLEMLKKMQLPQVHGLINLIIKHATGQPMNMDEFIEKKKMRLGN